MERARIPTHGREPDGLLAEMATFRADDARYRQGRTFSLVYWAGDAHHALLERAHTLYLAENALNPMAFRSLRRMEADVVQMTASLLHGGPEVVGTMTAGGTESILTAVKTYRDRARSRRPWVRRWQIVVPESAHPAFDKAAHLLDMGIRRARVREDGQVDVDALFRLVDRRTALIVASAPQYPVGTVDPVPEIAARAKARRVPLHVDACVGGFLLPWLERLGVAVPTWDFRVDGVTSISADLHKFGYAAKGASVLLYRDMRLLRHQFFVSTRWAGGVYASPGLPGTRPGGPIAAAWAAMHALGEDGYLRLAREAWDGAERLRVGIAAIPGLCVLGRPHATIVTWAATGDLDVYAIADRLEAAGWSVDRQQHPPSVHCTVSPANGPALDAYLADLREAAAWVRVHPEASGMGQAAVYGAIAKVPIDGLARREVRKALERAYAPDGGVIEVDAAPDPRVRRVLDRIDAIRSRWRR